MGGCVVSVESSLVAAPPAQVIRSWVAEVTSTSYLIHSHAHSWLRLGWVGKQKAKLL
jgi:hypothetical protein